MRTLLAPHTRDENALDLAHQGAVRSDILAAPSSLTCRLDKTFAELAAHVVPLGSHRDSAPMDPTMTGAGTDWYLAETVFAAQ